MSIPATIRPARPEDAAEAGRVCYEAFHAINTKHGFIPDLPSPEAGAGILSRAFSHPGFWCVIAERGGKIIGSNCLDERSAVHGIGPITIDPAEQNSGVGRLLMDAVMERSRQQGAPSLRLVQAAFHNRSLSLYTKLGFDAREPLSVMQGEQLRISIEGVRVRAASLADLDAANAVCRRVHGHSRGGELRDGIEAGSALVVERGGRITGYASALAFFGHAVGETNLDIQALIGAAESFAGPGILVPTRNAELLRWCLSAGLRIQQPMTLMSTGLYSEPAGAFLPSILF
jgi:GNAT superfamily N-acetyltransferase